MRARLNVLALHAEAAATLGIRVGALRKGLFFVSGRADRQRGHDGRQIGFVGLIVPHACRFAFGPDHRVLIPVGGAGRRQPSWYCATPWRAP
jgi:iron complex transport system permease protein